LAARILDGAKIRDYVLAELRSEISDLTARGVRPGLAAVLAGDDPASKIYVRNKILACERLGIYSETFTPPAEVSTREMLALVEELNNREEIDGILVQLPLPKQVDADAAFGAVLPEKDVDGFHPVNMGRLAAGQPGLVACTPAGLIEILKRGGIPMEGRRAVVLGRSRTVGKPAALLLLQENATVTVCHSRTRDLPAVCREADILVAAMGRPAMVTREFLKPGVTVLDVGINRIEDAAEADRLFRHDPAKLDRFREKGSVLVGDVHPGDVAEIAGAYTPVPGGVGPLTVAMLMVNTVKAARNRRGPAGLMRR